MRGLLLLVLLALSSECLGKQGFGPGEQEWGYVTVRPKAHMFWWLYFTTAKVDSYYEKPLVIWLQGGPGGSSTSFGNFEELGPLDSSLEKRNYTWVKDYNVLFIDNPVGTGYSYVEDRQYSVTNKQIADDLVECMRGFYQKLPEFADVPAYITTESYGGKMGAEFALEWYKAEKAGTIKSNLKGVGLGDSWISPIDSVMTWAPFLLATGMIDRVGYDKIESAAVRTQKAVESGQWGTATDLWSYTEGVILDVTNNIDFYNILTQIAPRLRRFNYDATDRVHNLETSYNIHVARYRQLDLNQLMNGPVKQALGVTGVYHGGQSGGVFASLREDFMKPVTNIVEKLLNETDVEVFVYSGHMDLIVDTPGTVLWVEGLKWKYANAWLNARRTAVISGNVIEGYVKAYGKLKMYWVNRAGHMVPRDNPAGMAMILEDLTTEDRL